MRLKWSGQPPEGGVISPELGLHYDLDTSTEILNLVGTPRFALTPREQEFLGMVHAWFCLRELSDREGDAYTASLRHREMMLDFHDRPELTEEFERGARHMQESLRGKGTDWAELVDRGWEEIARAFESGGSPHDTD